MSLYVVAYVVVRRRTRFDTEHYHCLSVLIVHWTVHDVTCCTFIYSQHLLLYRCPIHIVRSRRLVCTLMVINARVFYHNFSHLIQNGCAIQVYRHQYKVTYPRMHKLWTLSLMLIRE